MIDVVMPQMGESIVEGTLTKWLKKIGDKVERDEPLFEISTDKVDTEIPAPAAGVLSEIFVEEGKTVGDQHGGRKDRRERLRRRRRPNRPRMSKLVRRLPPKLPSRRAASTRLPPAAPATAPEPPAAAPNRWRLQPVPIRFQRPNPAGRGPRAEDDRTAVSAGSQDGARVQHRSASGERHRRGWPHHQAGSGSIHVGSGRQNDGPEHPPAAPPPPAPTPAPAPQLRLRPAGRPRRRSPPAPPRVDIRPGPASSP